MNSACMHLQCTCRTAQRTRRHAEGMRGSAQAGVGRGQSKDWTAEEPTVCERGGGGEGLPATKS